MPLESSLSPKSPQQYELSLKGSLHRPNWIVHLFAALSERNVSIISGSARQERKGEWKSRFLLDFSNSSADPKVLDYTAFTEQTHENTRSVPPKLSAFEVVRRSDDQLEVTLEGPDQIGFLASILGRVSGLALFPSSLEIETPSGNIRDLIVFRGIADKVPSEEALKTLERMLKRFLIRS
jgi:hypothetical protein